jgi:hypothetical protein
MAPICRSASGSIMAITPWLHTPIFCWLPHADHCLAPICRSVTRGITTTPAERSGAYLARLPDRSGLPRYYGESASALIHFGACTVFTLVTARTLRCPPYRGLFLKCFRPFVASWPAPSAVNAGRKRIISGGRKLRKFRHEFLLFGCAHR